MNASVGMDLIRSMFAMIDKAVYSLITVLYNLLLQLANTSIFTNDNIQEFSSRIYVFLGIIMLFKVTFSLIQYLVNPDSITDKTTGTGNLIKNLIITLFLIIIVPFGFDVLYSAQSAIINDELIPRLILGTPNDQLDNLKMIIDDKCIDGDIVTSNANGIDNNGDYIALMAFRPFFQVYDDKDLGDGDLKSYYCGATNVSSLLRENIYNAETGFGNNGQYIVDYSFFLSTACGILVMLLLLEFCFDVSMRCIKLGFLEIFAPVAIISYIDPKSSKNGTFSKWLKEVFGTWARLFIRLVILFFAIYIIKIVNENEIMYKENGMWVMLFLIIGALLFAKKAVPLIEDLLGFKFDHSIQLNPFKKISDQALFGKQALGVGAAAGTWGLTTTGAIGSNWINTFKNRDKIKEKNPDDKFIMFKKYASGLGTGLLSGSWNGLTMGYKAGAGGKYNILKTSMDAIEKSSKDRNLAGELIEQHVVGAGPFAKQRFVVKDKFSDVIGLQGKTGTTDELKDKLKEINVQISLAEDMRKQSDEFLTRFKQTSSEIFRDALNKYDPFNRAYDGINGDGQVIWKNKLDSFEEFVRKNGINFSSSLEADECRRDYETFYRNEKEYREAFNEILKLQKQQSKLTKNEESFKGIKAQAKK